MIVYIVCHLHYQWTVDTDNKVVAKIQSGPNRGLTLNPLTTLAHKSDSESVIIPEMEQNTASLIGVQEVLLEIFIVLH